jgi:hypothetical protein
MRSAQHLLPTWANGGSSAWRQGEATGLARASVGEGWGRSDLAARISEWGATMNKARRGIV